MFGKQQIHGVGKTISRYQIMFKEIQHRWELQMRDALSAQ